MPLTILPPELLTEKAPASKEGQKFDRREFFPTSLTPDTSESFRLLGCFSTGHSALYWRYPTEKDRDGELRFAGYNYAASYPGTQPEGIARQTDWSKPDRPKLDNEFVRPKSALVWLAWSYERNRAELLIVEQKALKEAITEVLQETEDFTFSDEGISNFTLKIARKGGGVDTSYSVLPKISAKIEPEVADAFVDIKDKVAVKCLLHNDGSHPMNGLGEGDASVNAF